MFDSLLVANRGEIACRIFRTARALGLRTIAVYSDADAGARHVRAADEALWIGAAAPRESYLDIGRIIAAARASGAAAIHPGYGFLAENAALAEACAAAGIVFVGPPAAAIAAMGSKIVAKARMRAAGVPVLPGYEGAEQGLEALATAGRRLGLPLIVKPAAGGGGKGMQIVRSGDELAPALSAARRLAESAFGDGALLLERYLPTPRHVEVQVFADQHGGVVHLGDRDCSIQRRQQKLIEEAPAPGLPPAIRARLHSAAVTVARCIGYVGAGTVEFLFEGADVYFMEMNTRLQVEHTVTEAVTGLDLVEWQLRVACGEPLPRTQEQITLSGHAIEARVCAEDPARDFLPSAGRLELLRWPEGPGIRVDAGFGSGDIVPPNYDSLLGKVIAFGPDRESAARRLARALGDTLCVGVRSNERFLARVLGSEEFRAARHHIAWLGSAAAPPAVALQPDRQVLALAALAWHAPTPARAEAGVVGSTDAWACADGFVPNLGSRVRLALGCLDSIHRLELEYESGRITAVRFGDDPARTSVQGFALASLGPGSPGLLRIEASFDGRRCALYGLRHSGGLQAWTALGNWLFSEQRPGERADESGVAGGGLSTPLPGVVVSVRVIPGQSVAAGEVLMVLEAMKMEHTIVAPVAGVVRAVRFAPGDRVAEGSTLIDLDPPTSAP